jgi:C-terminal processing protease CtpA/Prc
MAKTAHSVKALALTLAALGLVLSACAAPHGTIGAVLAQREDHTLVVREVPKGLASAKAGVEPGDELLLIDGRDVRAMSTEQVHRSLSGEVGEPVKLTLIRGDRIVRVTLQRSPAPPAARPRAK